MKPRIKVCMTPYRIKGGPGRLQGNGFFIVNVPEAKELGIGFQWRIRGFDYGASICVINLNRSKIKKYGLR